LAAFGAVVADVRAANEPLHARLAHVASDRAVFLGCGPVTVPLAAWVRDARVRAYTISFGAGINGGDNMRAPRAAHAPRRAAARRW
jgi:hypothetical protein